MKGEKRVAVILMTPLTFTLLSNKEVEVLQAAALLLQAAAVLHCYVTARGSIVGIVKVLQAAALLVLLSCCKRQLCWFVKLLLSVALLVLLRCCKQQHCWCC